MMRKIIKIIMVILLIFSCKSKIYSQNITYALSKQEAKQILSELYIYMQGIHPNLYEYTSKEDYDKEYLQLINLLDTTTNKQFFDDEVFLQSILIPFNNLCGDGHSTVYSSIPYKTIKKDKKGEKYIHVEHSTSYDTIEHRFPFFFHLTQGKMYNCYNCFDYTIPEKSEIVQIGSMTAKEWIDKKKMLMGSERDAHKEARLNLFTHGINADSCKFGYIPHGKQDTVYQTQNCLIGEKSYRICQDYFFKEYENFSFQMLDENSIGIITLRFFSKGRKPISSFMEKVLDSLKTYHSKDLIIDLRFSLGGHEEVAEEVIGRITNNPYRMLSEEHVILRHMAISNNHHMKTLWMARKAVKRKDIQTVISTKKDTVIVAKHPMRIPKKRDHQYNGRIWVLTSALTYSAATVFASVVQDCHLGMVVGEETGGTPNMYGNPMTYQIANSHFYYIAPFLKSIRPSGDITPSNRGIIPDIEIQPNICPTNDVQLQTLIEIIKGSR